MPATLLVLTPAVVVLHYSVPHLVSSNRRYVNLPILPCMIVIFRGREREGRGERGGDGGENVGRKGGEGKIEGRIM